MPAHDKVNILLVDDQPAKLLSYEVILAELGESLIQATSAREALEQLLRQEIAVILVDVCMPELDGFQLAQMIREHPRFQKTAIIFISAVHLTDVDHLRAYQIGAVDYVPVPVVPEVLRAKVRVFSELYRKTRQLEQLNQELERRVAARTADLAASTARLEQSEERRTLALAAGQMGSWEWDPSRGSFTWDDGQYRIFGVDPATTDLTIDNVRTLIHPEDWKHLRNMIMPTTSDAPMIQAEFRVIRPSGELRWCTGTAVATVDATDNIARVGGVTVDITDRKQAEERQTLLAREVDHRARNALALAQSIVRLTRADTMPAYIASVEGRIGALSRAHTLLAQTRWQGADLAHLIGEELAPYRAGDESRIVVGGPDISLDPSVAQTLALALHELCTNSVKYGALSQPSGHLHVTWSSVSDSLVLSWTERGGPPVRPPATTGLGISMITASIEGQLEGGATFDWRSDGLHCRLSVPQKDKVNATHHRVMRFRSGDQGRQSAVFRLAAGARILLVEDEALVAMMIRDILSDLGFVVVGPFSRLVGAMVAAVHDEIDAGIIDVNLEGELVYPVADVLRARDIPFVFITGYGVESIDKRFAQVPMLKKPVQRELLQAIFAHAGRAETARSAFA
ncbi:MAG: two-component system response regulator protein-glutamate methylesterase [Proteobacteria bacterium]|nr:MAG: two-component system response regulator protein-glutamate methylesterase [Pseudomonadota bacterium]